MDLTTHVTKADSGYFLKFASLRDNLSVRGVAGMSNEAAEATEGERVGNWLVTLFLPGINNVIADLIPDNRLVRRVVVSQLSDITHSLTPAGQMYSDLPTILHFRPGPEAKADMFDFWELQKTHHTKNIIWVVFEGQDSPVHPYWVMCLRSFCEQNHIPFFFMSWGKWLCKPLFARPEIFREFGVLSVKWIYDGVAEGLEENWLEWGTFDFEGRLFDQTTTWNGRQLCPQDDYKATFFTVENTGSAQFVWCMEKGEPSYCLQFPK